VSVDLMERHVQPLADGALFCTGPPCPYFSLRKKARNPDGNISLKKVIVIILYQRSYTDLVARGIMKEPKTKLLSFKDEQNWPECTDGF
jgi:hypothetical protein